MFRFRREEPVTRYKSLKESRFIRLELYTETIFHLQDLLEKMILAMSFGDLIESSDTLDRRHLQTMKLYDYFSKDAMVYPIEEHMVYTEQLVATLLEGFENGDAHALSYYRRLSIPLIKDIEKLREALLA